MMDKAPDVETDIHGEEEIVDEEITEVEAINDDFLMETESGSLIGHNLVENEISNYETDLPEAELSIEEQLKSHEKLDRSSPDLWPQNLPTAAKQILYNNQLKTGETDPSGGWAHGLDPEDINLLHQFGSLTSSSLIEEVKKLQNIAYQLALDEKKEMTRGKLLHVLDENLLQNKTQTSNKKIES